MTTEVKRPNWTRFLKRFNATNQYRPVNVSVKKRGSGETVVTSEMPLMGLIVTKSGRTIDGLNLFTTRTDPESLAEPAISIKEPVKITAGKDKGKNDAWLTIEGKDGTRVRVDLFDDHNSQRIRNCVERLAYSIYERRGYQPGRDIDDWLEAERLINEKAGQLS